MISNVQRSTNLTDKREWFIQFLINHDLLIINNIFRFCSVKQFRCAPCKHYYQGLTFFFKASCISQGLEISSWRIKIDSLHSIVKISPSDSIEENILLQLPRNKRNFPVTEIRNVQDIYLIQVKAIIQVICAISIQVLGKLL